MNVRESSLIVLVVFAVEPDGMTLERREVVASQDGVDDQQSYGTDPDGNAKDTSHNDEERVAVRETGVQHL